ncbi:MAG TPA: helix-hairpin-helix domain-containing protein [Euzebyales bacterium]
MDDATPHPRSGGERLRELVGDLQLTPAHVTALLVAASFACAGVVALWWMARPQPVAAPDVSPVAVASVPPPVPSPSAGPLVVHVSGAVTSAGVVELPAGARVLDAVEAAGGLRRRARTDQLNLARPVVDGEQIHVPDSRPGSTGPVAPGAVADAGTGAAAVAGTAGPLSLNTASAAELEALPGIGPVLAGRIVSHRESVGGFTAVDELLEVSGIGEKTFAALRDLVTV